MSLTTSERAELEQLRAEKQAQYEATHCPCCGAFRPECVCWGSYTYDPTGKTRSERCSPQSHGRKGWGFNDG